MIHTNRCKHCGKMKEEHEHVYDDVYGSCLTEAGSFFEDSGLAALDAHKEELYEAIVKYSQASSGIGEAHHWRNVQSILNQIEKEK